MDVEELDGGEADIIMDKAAVDIGRIVGDPFIEHHLSAFADFIQEHVVVGAAGDQGEGRFFDRAGQNL